MGMLVIIKEFFRIKKKWNGAMHRHILEENLVQSVKGFEYIPNANSTLELLTGLMGRVTLLT